MFTLSNSVDTGCYCIPSTVRHPWCPPQVASTMIFPDLWCTMCLALPGATHAVLLSWSAISWGGPGSTLIHQTLHPPLICLLLCQMHTCSCSPPHVNTLWYVISSGPENEAELSGGNDYEVIPDLTVQEHLYSAPPSSTNKDTPSPAHTPCGTT